MSKKSLVDFLRKENNYQKQAMFEFRYPILFEEDCFLIEQLNFPKVDTNVGNVYLDGYKIPVHSTASFDNEISFTMYVDEKDFSFENGKYFEIFHTLLAPNHLFLNQVLPTQQVGTPIIAEITPLNTIQFGVDRSENINQSHNDRTIVLYNALIKSIFLSGGFTYNTTALAKFDVVMTYSFFENKMDGLLNDMLDVSF